MILHILRALFILLMAAVGGSFLQDQAQAGGRYTWLAMMVALVVGVVIVSLDILSPRKKLSILSGTFLGLLVGVFAAYALSFVVQLVVTQYLPAISPSAAAYLSKRTPPGDTTNGDVMIHFINLMVGISTCYLSISFVLQTKDDFRFVIPYVEFSKQTKGARPILLDTSVLIDGRINDIADSGILESQLVVPRFVLHELQAVADSGDKLKRNRGRRGLDVLARLQNNKRVEVILYEQDPAESDNPEENQVDQRLMRLGKELGARVLTNDFNLNKVAQLHGVDVVNINDLANALKPVVLPGEKMSVLLVKSGEQAGQGIGYLEDGCMVVVEQGRPYLNQEVDFTVTSVMQTSAGRMIFGRMGDSVEPPAGNGARGRGRRRDNQPSAHDDQPT